MLIDSNGDVAIALDEATEGVGRDEESPVEDDGLAGEETECEAI